MNTTAQVLLGIALLAGGLVLALAFPDQDLGWFRGQPLGIVLALIGAFDLAEALWRRR